MKYRRLRTLNIPKYEHFQVGLMILSTCVSVVVFCDHYRFVAFSAIWLLLHKIPFFFSQAKVNQGVPPIPSRKTKMESIPEAFCHWRHRLSGRCGLSAKPVSWMYNEMTKTEGRAKTKTFILKWPVKYRIRLDVFLPMQILGAKCRVELFSSYISAQLKNLGCLRNSKANPPFCTQLRLDKACIKWAVV